MLTDSNGCISYDSIIILNTLNIHELSNNNYIVYPNPTQNIITLSAFGEKFKNKNYIITNNNGRTISEGIINSSKQKIDFSSFKNGIYYITIDNYRKYKVIKF